MSFRVMQSLSENALARDELVRAHLSYWPCHVRTKPGGLPQPPLFTVGEGAEQLRAAGVAVIELPDLAARARAVNAHLEPRG